MLVHLHFLLLARTSEMPKCRPTPPPFSYLPLGGVYMYVDYVDIVWNSCLHAPKKLGKAPDEPSRATMQSV